MFSSALLRLQWFVRIRTPEAAASSGPGTKGVCRVLCFAQLPLQRTEKRYPDSCWPPSLAPPPAPASQRPSILTQCCHFPLTAKPARQRPHPPPATPPTGHTRRRPHPPAAFPHLSPHRSARGISLPSSATSPWPLGPHRGLRGHMGGRRSVLLAPPPAGSPVSLGGTPSSRPSGGRPLDSLPAQWDLPRLVAAPADGSFPSATLAHRPLSFGCAQETSQVQPPRGPLGAFRVTAPARAPSPPSSRAQCPGGRRVARG